MAAMKKTTHKPKTPGKVTTLEAASQPKTITVYDPNMGEILIHQMRPRISPLSSTSKTEPQLDSNLNNEITLAPEQITAPEPIVEITADEPAELPLYDSASRVDIRLPILLSLDGEDFINAAYREVLGRTPDPTGLHYYNQRLHNGIPRIQILGQLAASRESATAQKWYKELRWSYLLLKYRRMPVIGWMSELVCAFSHQHLHELLVHDDEQFIVDAFKAVLGCRPDQQSFTHYLAQLRAGRDKIDILIDLSASNINPVTRNRVAGLSAAFWIRKLRHTPIIKGTIDLLTLPSVAADGLKRIRALESSLQRVNTQQQADVASIRETLKDGHAATLALAQQLGTVLDNTAILIRQERAVLSGEINKATHDVYAALSNTQSNLAHLVHEATTKLETALPQAVDKLQTSIIARLNHTETAQRQLQQQLDKFTEKTATLLTRKHAALSYEINKATSDMRSALVDTQSELVQQIQESAALLNTTLPQSIEDIRTTILARLMLSDQAREQLRLQFGQHAISTAAMISKESAAVSEEIYKLARDMQTTLTAMQTHVQTVTEQLDISLPETIADVRMAILARLTEAAATQKEWQLQFDQQAANHAALINAKSSAVTDAIRKLADDIQTALTDIQTDLISHLLAASEQLNTAVPQSVEDIKTVIHTRLAETLAAQEQLRQQFGQYAASTAALISEEGSTVSENMHNLADDMHVMLSEIQADFTHHAQAVTEQLHTALPQTFIDGNTAILARLSDAVNAQERLRQQLNQPNPQLARIELYSLTAARRIAVPFGDSAVMVRTNVGYVLCANEDHALIATLIESGELEPGTRLLIQRILDPGDIFIDVGANIGMHTLAAAKTMRGQGRIIAFEPYPPTARLLEKTMWMNGFKNMVEIHCAAVSDAEHERTLYLGATSGHHSLFPLEATSSMDDETVKVHTATIDHVMANSLVANLMKIDAEGAELEVLAGAEQLIRTNQDIAIIAEFGNSHLQRINMTSHEWLERFSQLGLEYQAIHPGTGILRDISADELDTIGSINLFFARRQSPVWIKAGGSL